MSDITAFDLHSARVHILRHELDTVVLHLSYGDGEGLHLLMSRADFMGLAKRLATDAVMLSDSAPQTATN